METLVIIGVIVVAAVVVGLLRRSLMQEQQRTATLEEQVRAQTTELTTLRERVRTAEEAATKARTDFTERQRTVDELREELAAATQHVEELKTQLGEKDRHLTDLRAQHQASETENTYKLALTLTLANAAYDALIVVDKDCRIIAINTSAELLFDDMAALGKPLIDVTGSPELSMMVDDALTNQEESFEEQITLGRKNYRVQARVMRREGNMFIGLALRDITQLVRLNRARRDMVANISHELRTPIANIRLIIDGLFHEQDRPKRKDSISSLRAIARETDNLLWLVQEMSDLSMIESGQAIVRLVDVPLAELVDEAIERMVDLSKQYEINIVRHIPEKLRVLCDRDLAQRVLVNLIHNALKWSPEGEAVTVSATNGGDEVTVSVLDNGPGVPEDQVDRIFERFYQVDVSRSGGEGTGLGLAICRHIVEAHGGRIWAESNKDGSGGRFRFTLLSAEHENIEEEVRELS